MAEETFRWPYEDLALNTTRCPGCNSLPAAELVDRAIQPLYFCVKDTCPIFAWDPSVKYPDQSGPIPPQTPIPGGA